MTMITPYQWANSQNTPETAPDVLGIRRRATANRRAKGFTRHQHASIQPMERRHLCTRYHKTVIFQRRTWGIEIHSATLDPGVEQREKKHSNKFTLRRISPRSSSIFSSIMPRIETVESRNLRVYFETRTSYTESRVKQRAVKRRQWMMARLAAPWTHRSMLIDPETGCECNAGREDRWLYRGVIGRDRSEGGTAYGHTITGRILYMFACVFLAGVAQAGSSRRRHFQELQKLHDWLTSR